MSKIAIVISEYYPLIASKLLEGALQEARNQLINPPKVYRVCGAAELPYAAKQLVKTNKYEAIILLGCVIRGETDHYKYVCAQVAQGTQNLIATHDIPIISGLLTTYNKEQALARLDINNRNKGHKGSYALKVALEMIKLKKEIEVEANIE